MIETLRQTGGLRPWQRMTIACTYPIIYHKQSFIYITISVYVIRSSTRVASKTSAFKKMASAAPIDKTNVNRIKDAIRRGEYPIDLDRVSDALMEAYKEMKT